tara:strand:- start:582 stop:812 length:231 start_codon:yes stop_codon:yes gene_type:complete
MTNTNDNQEVHKELTKYEARLIREAAFLSPTIILDIACEDEELAELSADYEDARERLQDAAEQIANYCNIKEEDNG